MDGDEDTATPTMMESVETGKVLGSLEEALTEARAEEAQTELCAAARSGRAMEVGALLRSGVPPDGTKRRFTALPLHAAARAGHARVVRTLVEAGADVDEEELGVPRNTALTLAAMRDHGAVVKVLAPLVAQGGVAHAWDVAVQWRARSAVEALVLSQRVPEPAVRAAAKAVELGAKPDTALLTTLRAACFPVSFAVARADPHALLLAMQRDDVSVGDFPCTPLLRALPLPPPAAATSTMSSASVRECAALVKLARGAAFGFGESTHVFPRAYQGVASELVSVFAKAKAPRPEALAERVMRFCPRWWFCSPRDPHE